MGFPRQENWSGLPFPLPGDRPNPGIEPRSCTSPTLLGGFFRLKCLPAMRETWVRSLGREVPLEKEMATHSSILAWRIPWTEEPGGLQSTGLQGVGHDRAT